MGAAVEAGERSLADASMRNPSDLEQLKVAGEACFGKNIRRNEWLKLDHSQEGVRCNSRFGDRE